jgi:hypothetical protein
LISSLNLLFIYPSHLSLSLGSSILKGSDDGVMHFEKSCFRTLSIVQCFFFNNVSENGSASVFRKKRGGGSRVDATPSPFLPEGGSTASLQNVVLKKKTLDDG